MTLDFQGGEGLVDNLAGSQGGGLPRWHNLKHKQRVESRNLEIWKVLHLEDASLLLSPNGILPDAEKAPVVLRRLWKELELGPVSPALIESLLNSALFYRLYFRFHSF